MASVHCHSHYYSPTFFSLVQVYASELVNSISVFLCAAAKTDAAAQLQRDKKGGWIKWIEVWEQTVNIYPKVSCVFPSEHTRTHRKLKSTAACRYQIDRMIPGRRLMWNFFTHTWTWDHLTETECKHGGPGPRGERPPRRRGASQQRPLSLERTVRERERHILLLLL